MRALLVPAALLLAAATARDPVAEADRYERCLTLAREKPADGFETALQWQAAGGWHPAEHCAAVALVGLRQYAEAAQRLERLTDAMRTAPAALRAETLGQAANAWQLAGDLPRAHAALTQAIAIDPENAELLVDRAVVSGAAGRPAEAAADLDKVLATDPTRVDALVYRAAARRAEGHLDRALADVERALKLQPRHPEALLERGNLRRLKGDAAGARKDWVQVSLLAPGSPADVAAKANLETNDIKTK